MKQPFLIIVSIFIAVMIIVPAGGAAEAGTSGTAGNNPESYFLILRDGKTYGYSCFRRFQRDGDIVHNHFETLILFSRFVDKPDTRYIANELYSTAEKRPLTYEVTIDYQKKSKSLTCSFPSRGQALVHGESLGVSRRKMLNIPEKFILFDNNIYGQFELIFAELPDNVGDFSIPVFVPQVANMRRFSATYRGTKEIVVGGQKQQASLYYCTLYPLTYKVWTDSKSRLLRIEIPSMKFTVERVPRHYVRAFKALYHERPPAAELHHPLVFPSRLKTAAVALQLSAGELPFAKRILTRPHQRYTGTLTETILAGTFYRGAIPPSVDISSHPALEEKQYSLPRHVKSADDIESDLPEIKALARELAQQDEEGARKDRPETVAAFAAWVADTIEYKTGPSSAFTTMKRQQGPISGYANLTIALLRAAGIPARRAHGLAYAPNGSGTLLKHTWVEYFDADQDWHAVDPFMDQFHTVDKLHVFLPPIERIAGITAEIFALVPQPLAEPPLPLPLKDFTLPRERSLYYALRVGDRLFGYLHAEIPERDKSLPPGHYQYLSHLFIDTKNLGYDTATQKNVSVILDRKGRQIAYRCAARYISKVGVFDDLFDCKLSERAVKHIAYLPPSDRKTEVTSIDDLVPKTTTLTTDRPFFIVGQDMIDQWMLFTRRIDIKQLSWAEVTVYIPEQQTFLNLDIFGGDTREVEGVTCKRIEVPLLDTVFWVSYEGTIIKAEISSQRTEIVKAGPEVLKLKADEAGENIPE